VRTGIGIDTHRFAAGRPLILGGVEIPSEQGLEGHSDTDERWQGADSMDLLRAVVKEVAEAGWAVTHVDATIMLQRPKLAPHRDAIRSSLAAELGSVNVKFTTGEKMGFVGREEGVAALAVATLEPIGP
jgi:2-C-methyl-D-erythritol 2,4-cyclodiphosphate synthase